MVHVELVVNSYPQVNSLSRYADALYHELGAMSDVSAQVAKIDSPPLPRPLLRLSKRAGVDVDTFLQHSPLNWPTRSGSLAHLTHRAQATLIARKPHRPVVVTVHDIIHFQYRHIQEISISRSYAHRLFDHVTLKALRNADCVLASSEFTRQALVNFLGLHPSKVVRIYLGVDNRRLRPCDVPDAFFQRYGLDRNTPYVLHISSEEWRKNIPTLLKAFARVKALHPGVKLLKIGRPFYPKMRTLILDQMAALQLTEDVIFVDDVPDNELAYFYNIARLTAFPSLCEGFGFPVVESMICGTPVVCANASSLPEVAGDAALLVDPMDVEGMAAAMSRIIESEATYGQLRQAGLRQAATFTWRRTAEETVQVYRSVLANYSS